MLLWVVKNWHPIIVMQRLSQCEFLNRYQIRRVLPWYRRMKDLDYSSSEVTILDLYNQDKYLQINKRQTGQRTITHDPTGQTSSDCDTTWEATIHDESGAIPGIPQVTAAKAFVAAPANTNLLSRPGHRTDPGCSCLGGTQPRCR